VVELGHGRQSRNRRSGKMSEQGLIPVGDVARMAEAIATSKLFGMKTPAEAMALMLICQAEGMHPAIAARDYHIIQGRPTLKADAMLARFQAAGGRVSWTKYTDEAVAAEFSHPLGGKVEIEWSIKRASKIMQESWEGRDDNRRKVVSPLTDKANWKNYPRQMLRSRVISEGVRTVFPGVNVGMYTPEEIMDTVDVDDRPRAETTVIAETVAPKSLPPATPPAAAPPSTGSALNDAKAAAMSRIKASIMAVFPSDSDNDRKWRSEMLMRAFNKATIKEVEALSLGELQKAAVILEDWGRRHNDLVAIGDAPGAVEDAWEAAVKHANANPGSPEGLPLETPPARRPRPATTRKA
jgi:hypothetical protein